MDAGLRAYARQHLLDKMISVIDLQRARSVDRPPYQKRIQESKPRNDETLALGTSSVGGLNCVRRLAGDIRAGIRQGQAGVPIVSLQANSYQHPEFDKVFVPQLPIETWKSEAELTGQAPEDSGPAGLDDDIPFAPLRELP